MACTSTSPLGLATLGLTVGLLACSSPATSDAGGAGTTDSAGTAGGSSGQASSGQASSGRDATTGPPTVGTTLADSSGGEAGGTTESPPDADLPEFVGAWGELGTEPGQFIEPSSVELDAVGDVYVAGHEDRLQKFSPQGELIAIFGEAGVGPGEFDHPHGLAMDRGQGLLYAGDQENNRVQVLTTDGEFVRMITDPLFMHIHDVGIDPVSGAIFVGDLESNVVQKYDPEGTLLASFGETGAGSGQFVGVWGMSTDSTGRVYVADSGNARVQVMTSEGRFIAQWPGFTKPTGIFVDAQDLVYVCDSLADEIIVLDTEGAVLETWPLPAIVGSPSEPEDIAITVDGTHIYVADVLEHRVIHLQRAG